MMIVALGITTGDAKTRLGLWKRAPRTRRSRPRRFLTWPSLGWSRAGILFVRDDSQGAAQGCALGVRGSPGRHCVTITPGPA